MVEAITKKIEVSSYCTTETRPKTPEERLMAAVLEEAIATYQRGLHSSDPMVRQASREVDDWVRCRSDADLFSFENICAILEIDADYLRAGLRSIRFAARTAPAPCNDAIRKLRRSRITDRRAWRGQIGS